jgi:hypothetical protein
MTRRLLALAVGPRAPWEHLRPGARGWTVSVSSGSHVGPYLLGAGSGPDGIGVVFVTTSPVVPPASGAPGPTIAYASLPPATALPEGFPAKHVPTVGSCVDAGALGGTDDAIFASSSDPATLAAAYGTALAGYVGRLTSHANGTLTVVDFATSGGPGEIVLTPDPAGGMTVSVQVAP